MGWVFVIIIMAFGALFNLLAFSTPLMDLELRGILSVDLTLLLMAGSVWYSMNKKFISDLNKGKDVKLERVEKKENLTVHEAGSGNTYIPVLGDLFPQLWGSRTRELERYNFIINNTRHEVEKDLFIKVEEGGLVEMHIARTSKELIEIRPKIRNTRVRLN